MSSSSSPLVFPEPAASIELLASGPAAFTRILSRIERARRRIAIRCFEWRDDDTGQAVARALLEAANRGVEITIFKDRIGAFYEQLAARKQSFFHKQIPFESRWRLWGLMMFYRCWGSLRQTPSALADALAAHPNVRLVSERRFDHAKLFVFDDDRLILGGMGIGDDFKDVNLDFMVEIAGGDAIARLADRHAGRCRFDPGRSFDYLLHSGEGCRLTGESLAEQRLALINGVSRRLTIAMAYLGDPAAGDAICQAVGRGVSVTLLTAARADVSADVNLFACADILRRTGNPENLRLVLHPRMVHAKAIVGDGAWVDIGSTNFTRLSHDGYEELDVFWRDRRFAVEVEAAIEREAAAGARARLPLDYRLWRLGCELAITGLHRRGQRRS